MKNLDDTLLKQEEILESHRILKFEDGCKAIRTLTAKLPAQIGNSKCFIKADILLSKTSLKKTWAGLNLKNHKIKMCNEDVGISICRMLIILSSFYLRKHITSVIWSKFLYSKKMKLIKVNHRKLSNYINSLVLHEQKN